MGYFLVIATHPSPLLFLHGGSIPFLVIPQSMSSQVSHSNVLVSSVWWSYSPIRVSDQTSGRIISHWDIGSKDPWICLGLPFSASQVSVGLCNKVGYGSLLSWCVVSCDSPTRMSHEAWVRPGAREAKPRLGLSLSLATSQIPVSLCHKVGYGCLLSWRVVGCDSATRMS